MAKITNTSKGPRVLNVKVDKPEPGEQPFKMIVLQAGQTVEDVELLNPDGRFEQGLIESGDLVMGDIPTEPKTDAEAVARISELEDQLKTARQDLAEATGKLDSVTAERDALRTANPGTTTSGGGNNNRNRQS